MSVPRPWQNATAQPTRTSTSAAAATIDGTVVRHSDGRVQAQGFLGMLEMMGGSPDAVHFDGGDA